MYISLFVSSVFRPLEEDILISQPYCFPEGFPILPAL